MCRIGGRSPLCTHPDRVTTEIECSLSYSCCTRRPRSRISRSWRTIRGLSRPPAFIAATSADERHPLNSQSGFVVVSRSLRAERQDAIRVGGDGASEDAANRCRPLRTPRLREGSCTGRQAWLGAPLVPELRTVSVDRLQPPSQQCYREAGMMLFGHSRHEGSAAPWNSRSPAADRGTGSG